ncbi:MAG: DegV family protein [Anaerolineae bacterium]|nr:DegV family protein [Anaerolineae bacterium]
MPTIAIVTDSDSSLPPGIAAQYGIHQVPINIHFGTETLATGVDIDDAGLFERVAREGKLPTTSAPAPAAFAQAYQEAFDAGAEAIVCICVSGEISATYNAAVTASEQFPERDIEIVDSRTVSMAQGLMVLEAAKAAQQGADKEQIVARAVDLGKRSYVFAALATLKYLALSGRVGSLAAGMGNLLQVKPILTVKNGKLDMLEKVRTRTKAWARMVDLAEETLSGRPVEQMAIIHTNVPDQAQAFKQQFCARLACPDEIIVADFTAGLAVHTGEGLIGFVLVTAKE